VGDEQGAHDLTEMMGRATPKKSRSRVLRPKKFGLLGGNQMYLALRE